MKERISLVEKAHELVRARLRPGAIAIDATVGNGYDTLFLLLQIAPSGRVYGFDIQRSALESARGRIENPVLLKRLTLFHHSHARMEDIIPRPDHGLINVIMFNLGYLPGGDKAVTTRSETTLAALSAASRLLSPQGIITIVAYSGHEGGAHETDQVRLWCEQLDRECFNVDLIDAKPGDQTAPKLFAVTRKSQE